MTVNETKEFLERIKAYYPVFMVDDFFIKEWHKQLKDYDAMDINERFNQHLKSETYGEYVPKINFLTKGLRKIGETSCDKSKILTRCGTCNQLVYLSDYDEHIDKCKDIDYMIFLFEKYFNKKADREKLFEMDENTFKEKFKTILKYAIQNEKNQVEVERLKEIYELV